MNHTFLYSVLLKFGFDHNYIRWLKLLYNNAESCVINNGFTTKYFPLERGNRQGGPLSPYLFIMVLEVLASMVRHNDLIQGIKIGDTIIKQCMFADDCTFFLSNRESLEYLLKDIELFSKFSLLKINLQKSEIASIVSERKNTLEVEPLKWVNLDTNAIKNLGVFLTYNHELSMKLNFDKRVAQFDILLNTWKQRNLTIYGRNQIIKSLAMPRLLYVCNYYWYAPN